MKDKRLCDDDFDSALCYKSNMDCSFMISNIVVDGKYCFEARNMRPGLSGALFIFSLEK